jgi:hypothetical protein
MPRIKCRTPSTGKPIRISVANVSSTFATVAEAPDFSVPDASRAFTPRDPLDDGRAIKPGEIFFLSPLAAKNKSGVSKWIEVQLRTESNTTIEFGRIDVPAGDTAFIPLQGRSLFKRTATGANGDILLVRAQDTNVFDIWATAEEKLSSEHSGLES